MARLLGRVHVRGLSPNCATRDGRYCRDCGWDGRTGARAAKRLEARELAAEVDGELHPEPDFGHTATLGPLYDLSDCEHGCNGSPCGSDRCSFICHPDVEYEVWSTDSGNRLFVSPDAGEALAWAGDYLGHEGDGALAGLSLGDDRDRWVISGERLRRLAAPAVLDLKLREALAAAERGETVDLGDFRQYLES